MKQQPPHIKLDFTIEIGPNLSRALITLSQAAIAIAPLAARLLVIIPFYLLSGSSPLG